jgi:hypothetical protein
MKTGMRERGWSWWCVRLFSWWTIQDNKKPFRPLYIFKHVLKNSFILFVWVSDPSCREDSYHFFFDCSYYTNMRHTLFHNLSWLPNDCAIDLKLLTSGNPILSNEQNETIFEHMFEYIKRSERFLVVLYSSPREQSHTPSRPTPLSHSCLHSLFLLNLHILM